MNHFAAYTVPVPQGFWGMCRFAHHAQPRPIMDGDKPKVFPARTEALIAAQARVIEHINGTMVRAGDRCQAAKSAAEKLFSGGGRVVPVERKARASA